ncbi:MAG TPA: hypothetical protein VFL84_06950, partial [Gammaproteobacteria bacterium]|nr:hypothetical protein [Gammaproteobacteria bacterium]
MRRSAWQPVLAAAACGALVVAGSSTPSLQARPVPAVGGTPSAPPDSSDGGRWLEATLTALDDPKEVRMPYAALGELGGAADVAAAYAFRARAGQTLEITLRRDRASNGSIYVELFRVVDVLGQGLRERLTSLRPSATSIRARLPSDGTYQVLVQTGATGGGHYGLTLELDAALPFPVVGGESSSIRSLFGASRDAGRRNHEGVDIFVRR